MIGIWDIFETDMVMCGAKNLGTRVKKGISSKNWISVALGILGTGTLVWYLVLHSAELYRLRELSIGVLLCLSLFVLFSLTFENTMKLKLVIAMFDVRISFLECFILGAAGSLINLLPLNTALAARAFYLKKVHGLKLVKYGLGTVVGILTMSVSAGVLGLVGLCVSFSIQNLPLKLAILFLGFLFGPFAVWGMFLIFGRIHHKRIDIGSEKGETWLARAYLSFAQSLEIILHKPKIIIKILLVTVISDIIGGIKLWLVGSALGYPVGFFSGIVLRSASRVIAFFTIMPAGAIGLREAVIGASMNELGGEVVNGVMISIVDRLIGTFWVVLCGSISLVFVGRKLSGKSLRPQKLTPPAETDSL